MSFNQGIPGPATLINSSSTLLYGNSVSANALSVQQLGAGNVASFRTQTGASALFVSSAGNVGIGQTNPVFTLDTTGTARVTSNLVVGTQSTPTTPFWIQKNAASGISGTAQTAWLGQALITDANGTQFLSIGSDQTNAVSFLQAYGAGVNKPLSLQPNGGNVGIGITNPGFPLDVNTQTNNIALSLQSIAGLSSVGMQISCYNDSSKHCGIRNNNGGFDFVASTASGAGTYNFYSGSGGAYTTRYGGFNVALTGGATTLSVDANGYIIRTPSDERLKSNIRAISYGLSDVEKLAPVCYEWKSPDMYGVGRQLGMIAQEVQQIIPECVSGGETLSLDYQKLVPVLTKAIQELSTKNDALEQRLAALEGTIGSRVGA